MGQFEWELSNLHIAYPFEQPGMPGLHNVFADALVLDSVQGDRVVLKSISITSWESSGISAVVQYKGGSNFFSGVPTVSVITYDSWALVMLVSGAKRVHLLMNTGVSLPVSSVTSATFVTRVHECDPKSVTSIKVTDEQTGSPVPVTLTGPMALSMGYNSSLEYSKTTTKSRRPSASAISINATAGDGLGLLPNTCGESSETIVLRTMNSARPDNQGRFSVKALGCYRGYLPSALPTPMFMHLQNSIELFNDCEQCCKCTDYENVYRALSNLYSKGSDIGMRLAMGADGLNTLKDAVYDDKQVREIPTMAVFLRPSPGYILGVQIVLLNNSTKSSISMNQTTLANALVKVTITSNSADMNNAAVIPSSCYMINSGQPSVPWTRTEKSNVMVNPEAISTGTVGLKVTPNIVEGKAMETIKPTQSLVYYFETGWKTNGSNPPADGDEITVKVQSNVFSPGTIEITEKLLKPYDGTIE